MMLRLNGRVNDATAATLRAELAGVGSLIFVAVESADVEAVSGRMCNAPVVELPRLELAKAYERGNNLAGMLDQYRALRALAPQDPEYIYQMGQAYLKLSQWCLAQMRRLDPQSARIYESLAEAYRAQGQTDQAIRAFQRAAEADPKLPGVHLSLAQIYFEQRRTEDARREIEQELAIVPESVAARSIQRKIASSESKP